MVKGKLHPNASEQQSTQRSPTPACVDSRGILPTPAALELRSVRTCVQKHGQLCTAKGLGWSWDEAEREEIQRELEAGEP